MITTATRPERDGWGNRPDGFRPFFCNGRPDGSNYTLTMLDAMIHACQFALGVDYDGQDPEWQQLYDWAGLWLPKLQAAKAAPPCDEKLVPEAPWIPADKTARMGLYQVCEDFVEYEHQQAVVVRNDWGHPTGAYEYDDNETYWLVTLLEGSSIVLDPDQFKELTTT
jgi:hypothetical protein